MTHDDGAAADDDGRIARALARALGVSADSIGPASSPATLDAWDEAAQPAVVAALEAEFAVRFDKRTGESLVNVPAIRNALAQARAPARPPQPPGALAPLEPDTATGRIVVIGDDHVATLARHPAFLPLSLGGPWQAHFLALRQASQVAAKIAQLVARLPDNATVLLYFGGALEPLADPSFRAMWQLGGSSDDSLIEATVTRLLDTAEAIRRRCGGGLAMAALPPTLAGSAASRHVARYNEALAAGCRARDLPLLSVAAYVVNSEGRLRPGLLADSRRLSTACAPFFLDEMVALQLAQPAPLHDHDPGFVWRYGYRRLTRAGPVEVPGEDSLAETSHTAPWDDFAQSSGDSEDGPRSAGACEEAALMPAAKMCLAAVTEALALHGCLAQHYGRDLDVLILDCAEGLPAFFYPSQGTNRLVALDRDPRRIQLARRLAGLFDRTGIGFQAVAGYGGLAGLSPPVDVALVLDRAEAPPGWLKALFTRLQAVTGCILHRSRRPAADAALMQRAGFARTCLWPIFGEPAFAYLGGEAPAMGGLGRRAANECLVLGLTSPPSAEIAASLKAHLSEQLDQHADALEGRFAAAYEAALGPLSD